MSSTRAPEVPVAASTVDLAEVLPALIWRTDGAGRVDFVNQRLLRLLGAPLQELLGGGWRTWVHPEDLQAVRATRRKVTDGTSDFDADLRVRCRDGRYRRFTAHATGIWSRRGRVLSWWGVLVARPPEPEVPYTADPVLTARESQLSAAVIHELSQPLSAMLLDTRACHRWLSERPEEHARARAALDNVLRNGEAAVDVMRRTRALYQRRALTRKAVDLGEVARGVVASLRAENVSPGITLSHRAQPTLPTVLADPVQMDQLLTNLGRNAVEAVRATPIGRGTVAFNCSVDGEFVRVDVLDSGGGLPDPSLVFDPFFTTKEKGMGIGLSICRLIADAHGGKLLAAHGATGGAAFAVMLPRFRA